NSPAEFEPTTPEVKRYQRKKLLALLASMAVTLLFLAGVAVVAGPSVDDWGRSWLGEGRWLRLVVLAFLYAAAVVILTLPMDLWSRFALEHRYGLSKQSLGQWIRQRLKGYLVGGILGLVLVLGFYCCFWYAGSWWWVVAAGAYLAFALVLGRLLPVLILPL